MVLDCLPFSPKMQEKGGVFSHRTARERVYILGKNARERCVFVQRVYYLTTFLKKFGAMRQFSAILFKRGYILARVARKTACFLPKKCKRKGTVSETALAHPRTKISQVPPRALLLCRGTTDNHN